MDSLRSYQTRFGLNATISGLRLQGSRHRRRYVFEPIAIYHVRSVWPPSRKMLALPTLTIGNVSSVCSTTYTVLRFVTDGGTD